MNKEKFKSVIIEQFRKPDAPIRAFMLTHDAREKGFGQLDTYRKQPHTLYATEFDLAIHVERIQDAQGNPIFQIHFSDLPDGYELDESQEEWDLSGIALKNCPFNIETVEYAHQRIEFRVNHFLLTVSKEYDISYHLPGSTLIARFDAGTLEFDDVCTKADALGRLDDIREYAAVYNYYLYTPSEAEKLSNFIEKWKLADEVAGAIPQIFFYASHNPSMETPMGEIIRGLFDIKEKIDAPAEA